MNEIKTWQERTVNSPPETLLTSIETFRFMQAEIDELRAALKERGAPEPVAWIGVHVFDALKAGKCVTSTMTKHKAFEDDVQIFTRPPAVRDPLTEAEIIKIAQDNLAADPGRDGYILPIKFARAIEAAVMGKP